MKTNVVFSEPKYIINENKRTIVCIMNVEPDIEPKGSHYWGNNSWYRNKFNTDCMGRFQAKGVAKCSEDDEFDVKLGKKIAESKAKKQGFAIAAQIMETVFEKVAAEINQLASFANNCKAASFHEQNHINYLLGREQEV